MAMAPAANRFDDNGSWKLAGQPPPLFSAGQYRVPAMVEGAKAIQIHELNRPACTVPPGTLVLSDENRETFYCGNPNGADVNAANYRVAGILVDELPLKQTWCTIQQNGVACAIIGEVLQTTKHQYRAYLRPCAMKMPNNAGIIFGLVVDDTKDFLTSATLHQTHGKSANGLTTDCCMVRLHPPYHKIDVSTAPRAIKSSFVDTATSSATPVSAECDDTVHTVFSNAIRHLAARSVCNVAFGGGQLVKDSADPALNRNLGIESVAGGMVRTSPGTMAHAFMTGSISAGKSSRESRKARARRIARYDQISGSLQAGKSAQLEKDATPWDGLNPDVTQAGVDAARDYVSQCMTTGNPFDGDRMDTCLQTA